MDSMSQNKKVSLISLGCAKNLVDSENMLGFLNREGYEIVAGHEDADIAVVNTCGFVQSAVEESIDTILNVAKGKTEGRFKKLIVVGCFVQRYGYKLQEEIPEVDAWLGAGEIGRIVQVLKNQSESSKNFFINRPMFLADHTTPRIQTTPFYSSYLKIAEGCSHQCSYCTIPSLRGPYRSRDPESIIIEAREMVERRVKEINLIAQDTTLYGMDLDNKIILEDLLERLLGVEGVTWIRLLYCHPNRISDRLLQLLDEENALCPYLDIPFQHANEDILRAMGRSPKGEGPRRLIERIKSKTRRISLRTTLMVGFPGESDEIYQELIAFVKDATFDHLGAFIFSPEKGTPAAKMEGLVDPKAAEERRYILMELQAKISLNKNRALLGNNLPVLIEGESLETELLIKGRSATMAPDVDNQVLINKGRAMVGEIMPVFIKEAYAYDLVGEIP